jgi:hypothetical protein
MNNNEFNDGSEDDVLKSFESAMKSQRKRHDLMRQLAAKSASDGHSDVAEAMHIISDEINRSSDLNVGAMICVSKTFDSTFRAIMKEIDANSVAGDPASQFVAECGIVNDADGCFHCAPGSIHLHDLQLLSVMAAFRFFLFSRLRKIESALPIIRQTLDGGDPEMAHGMLAEAMASVGSMMKNISKMGFDLRHDHPVAELVRSGNFRAGELMGDIIKTLAAKNGK